MISTKRIDTSFTTFLPLYDLRPSKNLICGEILDVYVYQFGETAKKQNKIRFLDSRDQYLTEILPEVFQLTNLVELDIRSNQIDLIPYQIGNIKTLTRLELGRNHLVTVPSEIGQLTNLIRHNLAFNQIKSLPNVLFLLINLEVLNL